GPWRGGRRRFAPGPCPFDLHKVFRWARRVAEPLGAPGSNEGRTAVMPLDYYTVAEALPECGDQIALCYKQRQEARLAGTDQLRVPPRKQWLAQDRARPDRGHAGRHAQGGAPPGLTRLGPPVSA